MGAGSLASVRGKTSPWGAGHFATLEESACQVPRYVPAGGGAGVYIDWCIKGLQSLKRYWLFLIPFRSCISNGKPEKLLYLMFVFFGSNLMKSSGVYAVI